MSNILRNIILLIIICLPFMVNSQDRIIDSLEVKLYHSTKPIDKLNLMFELGDILEAKSKQKSLYYFEEAYILAQKNGFDSLENIVLWRIARHYNKTNPKKAIQLYRLCMAKDKGRNSYQFYTKMYNNLGYLYMQTKNIDSAEYFLKQAIAVKERAIKKEPDNLDLLNSIGKGYMNLGSFYLGISDYKTAIEKYYVALDYFIKTSDSNQIATTNMNIGVIHYHFEDYKNANKYFDLALQMATILNHQHLIASTLTNKGNLCKNIKDYNKADSLYKEALKIRLEIGPENNVAGLYENLGIIAKDLKKYDEALYYYNKSLQIKQKDNNAEALSSFYSNIGVLYHLTKKYDLAEESLLKALEFAKQVRNRESQVKIYQNLWQVYESKGEYKTALEYFKKYEALNDTIHNIKTEETINTLKEKFESTQKDHVISEMKQQEQLDKLIQEKQKLNNRLLFAFIVFIIVIAISVIVVVNNRRRSEKKLLEKNLEISQQRLLELVKDQEMNSINSFINGQEKERTRIAADLHDRLGSLLSTVKLHFSVIEPELAKDAVNSEKFKFAISLLDKTVSELRQVSQNLSKEILTEFGLVGAIQNLVDAINSAGSLKIVFVNTGFNLRLTYDIEIEIYRIIQEMVTNAIKHARATELVIQFVADDELLNITIEDDGVGFDINKVRKNGLGLSNIFERTSKVGGHYAIDSSPGNGTSFIFDLPIDKLTEKK